MLSGSTALPEYSLSFNASFFNSLNDFSTVKVMLKITPVVSRAKNKNDKDTSGFSQVYIKKSCMEFII